jgi:hypothetical protein
VNLEVLDKVDFLFLKESSLVANSLVYKQVASLCDLTISGNC